MTPHPRPSPQRAPRWGAFPVLLPLGVALALRCTGFERVFTGAAVPRLALHDAGIHARRALYSLANFPRALFFDAYQAFPDGAVIPMPPGYDWAMAGVARLLGGSEVTLVHVMAFVSPLLGALAVLPVFAVARRAGGRRAGLMAAWIYALLPAAALLAGIGNADHHAAVALLAAALLASSLGLVEAGGRAAAARTLGHAALLAALLLTWSGSLLYLGIAEGSHLLLALLARNPRRALARQAAAAACAALAGAPVVAGSPAPPGGALSTVTLSAFHLLALAALAALAALLAWIETRWPRPPLARLLRAAATGGLLGGLLLAPAPVREALAPGTSFVAKQDAWATRNPEQQPLFAPAGSLAATATQRFGLLAYAVPLLPLLPLLGWRRSRRSQGVARGALALWGAPLTVLTLAQVRFANDLAVPASASFALALTAMADALTARSALARRARRLLPGLAVALLLGPAVYQLHAPRLRGAWLRHGLPPERRPLSARESFYRFADTIRALTPETAGYLDDRLRPTYGLLAPPTLGHSLLYAARRPLPAGNLGPYLDAGRWAQVERFFHARSEAEGVSIARDLRSRYVLAPASAGLAAASLHARLARSDGSATARTGHLEHFRLLAEGPPGGRPLRLFFPGRNRPPGAAYKLYELVEGADLDVVAEPGSAVCAELPLQSALRRLRFVAVGRADARGRARLRVPLPSARQPRPEAALRATGPWRVSTRGGTALVELGEAAVRSGGHVAVPAPVGGAPADLLRCLERAGRERPGSAGEG